MIRRIRNLGPGTIVAAAFIGPGTVTTCSVAGVQHNFTLLWAVLVSILATIVLQEMSARIGLVSGQGVTESIAQTIQQPMVRGAALFIVVIAIVVGNAAYEAGNISGGVLGWENIAKVPAITVGAIQWKIMPAIIGVAAFLLLFFGGYKWIEKSLVGVVLLMSLMFMLAAVMTGPSIIALLEGVFVPRVPEKGWLSVLAIVGTTVVPYNIFLHASLVQEKWKDTSDIKAMRQDTYFAVILGGMVSMSIIVAAAAVGQNDVNNAGDLAKGLAPLLGDWAPFSIGIGLFAAGISSAITAPLAAGYVVRGLTQSKKHFRWAWIGVLCVGVVVASMDFRPIHVIQLAQIANGLLLPIIAGFLIYICNQQQILGKYRNNTLQNVFAVVIFLVAVVLGVKSIGGVF